MHSIKVAILTPNSNTYTETFIHNHIKFLPFDKVVIYGDVIPYKMDGEDDPGFKLSLLKRIFYKLSATPPKTENDYKRERLSYLLKKYNIRMVFAEYVLTGGYVCSVCKELNIPVIATGLGYELAKHKILEDNKDRYRDFFKYCSAIIIVAKSMEKTLVSMGCPSEKIIHSPAGASEEFLAIEPDYNSFQIVAIGRFIEKKSPHLTLLAFYKVLQKFPKAKLIFAGDGPLLGFCKDIAKAMNMDNSVEFVGKITQEQQRQLFAGSRMFVQHSRIASDGDSEGTPVAIVEASSAGLPIVSTLHAGIIDVVINGETGYLVEEGDADTMALKMIDLLSSSELAQKIGSAGKRNIRDNFTLQKHIDVIEKAILNATMLHK